MNQGIESAKLLDLVQFALGQLSTKDLDTVVSYATARSSALASQTVVQAVRLRLPRQQARQAAIEGLATLTRREREVLSLLVDGNSNKEVARKLEISPRTVEIHRSHVLDKTRTRTVLDLVTLAFIGGPETDVTPPGMSVGHHLVGSIRQEGRRLFDTLPTR